MSTINKYPMSQDQPLRIRNSTAADDF